MSEEPAELTHHFVVPAGEPAERIDKVLPRLLPTASRATIQRWIGEGRVLLDGQICRPRDFVRAGSTIAVRAGAAPPTSAAPDQGVDFSIVHEDEDVVVVDKPAGLVVHPARGHRSGTLVNGLLARCDFSRIAPDPDDPQGLARPGIVHRIDKDTSGLLVVSKTDAAREHLKAQLATHRVERVYLAITCGVPRDGTIRTRHGRHPRSRLRFTSRIADVPGQPPTGKLAVTHVRVRERLADSAAALIECRLETGRTHQIRVHLSEQTRTPLLGDALYGGVPQHGVLHTVATSLARQALHAAVLGFVHPGTGQTLRFESPLPSDFERALGELRGS